MSILTKQTIQRLAVLHAVSRWKQGAFGPVRVHKTLFFADKQADDPRWRLFTFKKYLLGQYSDEISEALNGLADAGCIETVYDGPSGRIRSRVSIRAAALVEKFFKGFFPKWSASLNDSFDKWAYLTNDQVITQAHDDPTYTAADHGQVIFESFDAELVEFNDLDEESAEALSDLVDDRLHTGLRDRMALAAEQPGRGENWRKIYFGRG